MNDTANIPATEYNLIIPITQFLFEWINNPIFFQDFIYSCPFNPFLVQHFISLPQICPMPNAWHSFFKYVANIYKVSELADLVYEALHDLGLVGQYIQFLEYYNHYYLWPTGKYLIDPLITTPQKPIL